MCAWLGLAPQVQEMQPLPQADSQFTCAYLESCEDKCRRGGPHPRQTLDCLTYVFLDSQFTCAYLESCEDKCRRGGPHPRQTLDCLTYVFF